MQQPDFDAMERNISLTQPSQSMNAQKQPQVNQLGSSYLQSILGAGDAVRNTIASAANTLSGTNIPMAQSGNGPGYGLGNAAGNIGAFVGGGDVLDTLRLGAEGMPLIGRAAQYLGQNGMDGGLARRAIGSGIYGSLTSPNNNLHQGEIGAGASLALDSVPYVGNTISAAANYLMPQKFAQSIIEKLGGAQDLNNPTQMENATKSVIKSINTGYNNAVQNSKSTYENIRNQVPSGSIYATPLSVSAPEKSNLSNVAQNYSPSAMPENIVAGSSAPSANESFGGVPVNQTGPIAISQDAQAANQPLPSSWATPTTPQSSFSNLNGQYPNLPSKVTNKYMGDSDLEELHNNFIQNPTFDNAHTLQSELGSYSRALGNGAQAPTPATVNTIRAVKNARNALKSDINTFLSNESPQLAQAYNKASQGFQQNVVPYRTDPDIYGMATGETTNMQPSTFAGVFKAPDANMAKVISDLPSDSVNKILYTKLGQSVPNKSAQGLINSYYNLDQQGLGSYVTPEMRQNFNSLDNRIKARNAIQSIAGTAAGAIGGSHFGPMAAAAGAVGGLGLSAVANPFINYAGRRLPLDAITSGISNGMRGTYAGLRNAILANQLNNSSNGGQ
jgi:hypothetical protein